MKNLIFLDFFFAHFGLRQYILRFQAMHPVPVFDCANVSIKVECVPACVCVLVHNSVLAECAIFQVFTKCVAILSLGERAICLLFMCGILCYCAV